LRRDRVRLAACLAGMALIGVACGNPRKQSASPPSTPSYRPQGTLLLEVGTFAHEIVGYELPSGPPRRFNTPFYGSAFGGGSWGPGDVALAMVPDYGFGQNGQSQLYRLAPNGRARALGSWLPGTQSLDVRGDRAAAWGCFKEIRTIRVMDLSPGGNWTKVADGCSAALSPDGNELAYVKDRTLWKLRLPDGAPERLVDLSSVPGLADMGITEDFDQTSLVWGEGGIAVGVGATGGYGIVVYRPGGKLRIVSLGSTVVRQMEWQPGGRLLGFGDFVPGDQIAEVRLFDPGTGATTQIAATPNYGQFKWSPDGAVLAVVRTDYVVAFIDTTGRTLTTLPIRGVPDDWAP
jgi:hypothetical protein